MKLNGKFLLVIVIMVMNVTVALPDTGLRLMHDEIDLGSFEATEVREGRVTFRNDSDSPLTILRVTSDCGCTVPSYPRDEIQPGDTASIRVRFDGKGREPGNFKKVIRIVSKNRDSQLRSLLFVKGKILRPIRK